MTTRRRLAASLLSLALLTGTVLAAPSAQAGPTAPPPSTSATPPPAQTNGTNVGTSICSSNAYCGADRTSRPQPTELFSLQSVGTSNQIVSANGVYRAYVHGQTCRITVEVISTHRVLWASPNRVGCGPRDSDDSSDPTARIQNNGGLVNYVSYNHYGCGGGCNSFSETNTWAAGTSSCRGASSGVDLVMMNEGFIAVWTQSYSVIGRQQIWNMNYNGQNQNGTLDCK